jgi:TPR repeat protein
VFQQSWVKRAQIRTGIKHSVNGRLLSLPTLRENAEKGDAIAQYKLGSSYLSGSGGVQQDYAEAANWFKLAAVQGLAAAQFDLGYLYQEGKGVAKDYVASANYYRAR